MINHFYDSSWYSTEFTNKGTSKALREKCPNTELFLVRIFRIIQSGPEITPYLDTFQVVKLTRIQWTFTISNSTKEISETV